jgi:K+-transporting ATPase A subunit
MPAKIVAFILTSLINMAVGIVFLFGLIVAMNGYSEGDATPGLITYIVLALLITALMAGASVLLVNVLLKREMKTVLAAAIAVPIFSIVGTGLMLVASGIGVGVAEFVRVNY